MKRLRFVVAALFTAIGASAQVRVVPGAVTAGRGAVLPSNHTVSFKSSLNGITPFTIPSLPSSSVLPLSVGTNDATPSAVASNAAMRPSAAAAKSAAVLVPAAKAVQALPTDIVSFGAAARFTPSAVLSYEGTSASGENSNDTGKAIFDGASEKASGFALPTASAMLSRAAERGVTKAQIAKALTSAASPAQAAANLTALGLLAPGAYDALGEDAPVLFETPLRRLWLEVAPEAERPFSVDRAFPVPALKVEKDGVTYFVHGVVHGQLRPAGRDAVLATVKRIAARGAALYSEQNLPVFYGYSAGLETLDHGVTSDAPAPLAAPSRAAALKARLADAATLIGGTSAAVKLALVGAAAASPLPWLGLAALLALLFVYATSKLPLLRLSETARARRLRAQGLVEMAELAEAEAAAVYSPELDPETYLSLELPTPLGSTDDPVSMRSRAMAAAAAAHAAGSGAKEVHIVAGWRHAPEIAWTLSRSV